ncbi:glycosyltransferase [Actinoplanes sp. NPDC051513]|uniref:glycosyltransferase n=1 Tax=Actinoplanes sp. NPDC051513 TaxID=3363908 RepID=UPI00379B297E
MVRIAHFSDAAVDGVNGIATSVRLLVDQLAELGHESLVTSTGPLWRPGGRVPSLDTGMGDFRFALFPMRGLRSRVGQWRPDIAHVHTPGPLGAAGLSVAKSMGIPAVYTYHTDMHGYSAFYHFPTPVIRAGTALYARFLPRGAKVTGRGKYAAVEAGNARVFEAADVIILPTATALRHCSTAGAYARKVRVISTPPGHRGESRAQRKEPIVLFVGRVCAEKGIPLLLDAFKLLLRVKPEARLVLAGPVSSRFDLRRRLVRAGLTGHVDVTGTLHGAEVPAAYRSASVFAFPSTTDTQGIVLHEAALAGLPIVMVDRELAAGHPLGAAVRLADPAPASLASALRASLEDENDVVERAQQIAYGLTPALFAEQTLDAYRAALMPVGRG